MFVPLKPAITGCWIIEFDGLCEPRNPGGRMCMGWHVDLDGEIVTGHQSIAPKSTNTNNDAEWFALGFGLLAARERADLRRPAVLVLRGDSQLVVNQLKNVWRIKKPLHQGCYRRCLRYLIDLNIEKWEVQWVPRDQNTRADALSRQAYIAAEGKPPPERHRRTA